MFSLFFSDVMKSLRSRSVMPDSFPRSGSSSFSLVSSLFDQLLLYLEIQTIWLWEHKWTWIYQQQKRMHLITFRRKWEAQLRRSTRQRGEGLRLRSWPTGEGENDEDQLSRRSYRRMVRGFPAWKKWRHPSNTWLIFRPGKSLRQAARLVKTMASLLW